jgi:short-subunit dehydrogenase
VYSGTKAFMLNFTESVINGLEGTRVTMTVLRPGATDADFFRKEGGANASHVQQGNLADPAKVARDGYQARMRGDDQFVSGVMNKVMDTAGRLLPKRAPAAEMRKTQELAHPNEDKIRRH